MTTFEQVKTTDEHPMAEIARTGSLPMTAKPILLYSQDDKLQGIWLASEALALAKTEGNRWKALAATVIGASIEARAVMLTEIKKDETAATKELVKDGADKKVASSITKSAGVAISKIKVIANAFNVGATITGLVEFHNKLLTDTTKHLNIDRADVVDVIPYETLVTYARTFSSAKAGRKPDTFTIQLNKWLTTHNPEDTGTDAENAAYAAIVAVYNGLPDVGKGA